MTDDQLWEFLKREGKLELDTGYACPVRELYRRYTELKGEFFARRDNL